MKKGILDKYIEHSVNYDTFTFDQVTTNLKFTLESFISKHVQRESSIDLMKQTKDDQRKYIYKILFGDIINKLCDLENDTCEMSIRTMSYDAVKTYIQVELKEIIKLLEG